MEDDTLVLFRRNFGDKKEKYSVATEKYGKTVLVPKDLYNRLRLVVRYQDADEEGKITLRVLATGAYAEFIEYLKRASGGTLPPVVHKESGPRLLRVTAEGRVAFARGGEDVYFIGPTRVPKELYDDFGVCEQYEAMRATGIATDEAVAMGEKCAATVARLKEYVRSQGEANVKPKKKQGAVVKSKTSGPAKSKTSKMPTLKKGVNSRGVTYYKVDGKFVSKADYCAAGGRAKVCKKAEGKKPKMEKKEKKVRTGYYKKKGKDGVVRYFKDGKFVSKAEYDAKKKK